MAVGRRSVASGGHIAHSTFATAAASSTAARNAPHRSACRVTTLGCADTRLLHEHAEVRREPRRCARLLEQALQMQRHADQRWR